MCALSMFPNLSTRMRLCLLLVVLTQLSCVFASGQRKFNLFFTPTIYVEHDNIIQVRTFDIASVVRLTTIVGWKDQLIIDDLKFPIKPIGHGLYGADITYQPSVFPPTSQGVQMLMNFTIGFCTNTDCADTVDEMQSEAVWLARRSPLILSEVEKPIYRPGETVRVRFVLLRPEITVPLPASFRYPKRMLVRPATDDRFELRDVPDEAHDQKGNDWQFEKIFLTDSKKNLVKQWLNVTALTAAQLQHTLLVDDPQGTWFMTANMADQSETVSFQVQHYVLPRFVMHIRPPTQLSFESNHTEFTVCAKYTNGPPMLGSVRAVLCVCEQTEQADHQALMDNQTCPMTRWKPDPRPCAQTMGQLQSDGCLLFNVSTERLEFNNLRHHQWNQFSVVCAEAIEAGTGANVTKCETGARVDWRRQQLRLQFPSVYKPGLPVFGTVTVQNFKQDDFGQAYVTVSLTEMRGGCWRPMGRSRPVDTSRYAYATRKLVSINGTAEFFIPPIESNRTISLKATLHLSGSNESSEATVTSAPHPSTPVEHHTIRPFVSPSSSVFVQQWPMQAPLHAAQCPGTVSFTVIANTPLSNRTIYVQSVVRGQLIQDIIPPLTTQEPDCTDQDGHLGHYHCVDQTDSTRIQCNPGWTGENCMRPRCSRDCHAIGGSCDMLGVCVCNEGWTGKHCDQCVKAPGCAHGQCVQGHDCVCESGWAGPLCNQAEVVYERVPEEEKEETTSPIDLPQIEEIMEETKYIIPHNPRSKNVSPNPTDLPQIEEIIDETKYITPHNVQSNNTDQNHVADSPFITTKTIYEREISLSIDERWGPEATVLLYFYDDRAGEPEIVAMTVTIMGMENCINPASVLQAKSDANGIQFDTYQASPGQPLHMNVSLRGLAAESSRMMHHRDDKVLSDQVCFVRISDLSLTNFEQASSILDLKQYATKLQSTEHSSTWWSPKNPTDVTQTFKAAGIRLVSRPLVKYVHVDDYMCQPLAFLSRSLGAMDSPPMPGVAESNSVDITPPKPRLRDFFPEIWLFDVLPIEHLGQEDGMNICGFRKNLTAPDTITTWQASAYCTTRLQGLWIPPSKQLTVSMPFFVELTLPKQVKRGEILYLPVSVFVSAGDSSRGCLEVHVTTRVEDTDWLRIGLSSYTGCVCPGQKETFQLGLLAKGLGLLNVTAEAYATAGSALCTENPSAIRIQQPRTFSDMIRRQVRVVPEGKPKEMTMSTMVCLKPNETQAALDFPIPSVPNMIPSSLRIYASYSDEVLGPALRNLDSLVRLPMGCGEQNMLLVAPNVYVLDYLKTAPVVNVKETERLMRSARAHIASGYKGQLKYRLTDGSYSAFGQSDGQGSTWLTAFVLRVFARAYKIDPTIDVNWERLINETTTFLFSRMTSVENGCLVEKGRVIHAAMQGSLQSGSSKGKSLLLTSYVLAALHEIDGPGSAPVPSSWIAARADGQACFYELLEAKLLEAEHMQQFETYELAQVAYTMALLYPNRAQTRMLQQELIERQQIDLSSGSGDRLFWTATKTAAGSVQESADSADIETTCYAYLALTQTSPLLIDPFAVIRWLSAQQTSTGGFRSTQDTTLALQVIADGAKRLGLGETASPASPLEVTVNLHPDGKSIKELITVDKRRVLNRFAIPFEETQPMNSFQWTVTRIDTVGIQCLVIQNTLHYNVPDSTDMQTDAAFAVSIHVSVPSTGPNPAHCRVANLTVCVRPGPSESMQRDSGMLLVQVLMISGWSPIPDRLIAALGNQSESPRQAEFDEDRGTTSVYFDGFTREEAQQQGGWSQLKRCFTLDVEQRTYVENAEPGRLTVSDYYDTGRSVETTYELDSCKQSWILEEHPRKDPVSTEQPEHLGTTTTTTTEEPLSCPVCGVDTEWNDTIVTFITEALCQSYSNLYLFHVRGSDASQLNATLITIFSGNQTASWNATLNSTSLKDCPCAAVTDGAKLALIASSALMIYPGQIDVSLSYVASKTLLAPAQDIMWAIEEAQNAQLAKPEQPENTALGSFKGWGCKRIPNLYRYLKYKFL